jgi:hypothetical protein
MTYIFKNIVYISYGILFFLALFNPFFNYEIKAIPFSIVFCACIVTFFNNKVIDYTGAALTIYYSFIGFFFIVVGIIKENTIEGSFNYTFPLYVLFPIFWWFIFIPIHKKEHIKSIEFVIYISCICISLYILLYMGSIIGIIYFEVPKFEKEQNASFIEGSPIIKLNSLSTLVFAVPYIMAKAILDLDRRKILLYISLIIGLIGVAFSGRRMLIFMTLLSPFFTLLFSYFTLTNKKIVLKRLLILMTIVIIIMTFLFVYSKELINLDINSMLQRVLNSLDVRNNSVDESNEDRVAQTSSLINGWLEDPVFGKGYGSFSGHFRSDEKPWRYELSYLAQLFRTGTLGFILYMMGPIYIYYWLYKIAKSIDRFWSHTAISMAVGITSIFIAYSSNPYLEALDILWVIFLPSAFIHSYKKRKLNIQ